MIKEKGVSMKEYVLKYNGKISIYFFYTTILFQINKLLAQDAKACVIFDLTEVTVIESSVIPNLLVLGEHIERKTGNKPVLYINESSYSGNLKKYLYQIRFFSLCEQDSRFALDCDKYTGWPGKGMDEKNITVFFSAATPEELTAEQGPDYPLLSSRIWGEIHENLYGFAKEYLNPYQKFTVYDDEYSEMKSNMALYMTLELVKNSLIHGKSFSYVTYQINRARRKIYLTLSDFGIGFNAALNNKKDEIEEVNEDEANLRRIKILDEGDAIVKGVLWRAYDEKYGLYDVICRTLQEYGIVRIHSNTTRIVLTNNENTDLGSGLSYPEKDSYLESILKKDYYGLNRKLRGNKGFNYFENLYFPGVHVEIVLPI